MANQPRPKRLRLGGNAQRTTGPSSASLPAAALSTPGGHATLRNLGNTCFLNAVLQVLFCCPGLRSYLMPEASGPDAATAGSVLPGAESSVSHMLCELFTAMAARPGPHAPSQLLHRLRDRYAIFRSLGQQDAQELLRCLLQSVEEEATAQTSRVAHAAHSQLPAQAIGNASSNASSASAPLPFGGSIDHTLRCLQCDLKRTRAESFSDISLPILGEQCLSVCLAEHLATERLRGGDKYYCQACWALTEATRSSHIARVGATLLFHLKRTDVAPPTLGAGGAAGGAAGRAAEMSATQHLPLPLHLSAEEICCIAQLKEVRPRFELFAVVAHSGRSGAGHYVAYVRAEQRSAAVQAWASEGGCGVKSAASRAPQVRHRGKGGGDGGGEGDGWSMDEARTAAGDVETMLRQERSRADDQWLCFDDEVCSKLSAAEFGAKFAPGSEARRYMHRSPLPSPCTDLACSAHTPERIPFDKSKPKISPLLCRLCTTERIHRRIDSSSEVLRMQTHLPAALV